MENRRNWSGPFWQRGTVCAVRQYRAAPVVLGMPQEAVLLPAPGFVPHRGRRPDGADVLSNFETVIAHTMLAAGRPERRSRANLTQAILHVRHWLSRLTARILSRGERQQRRMDSAAGDGFAGVRAARVSIIGSSAGCGAGGTGRRRCRTKRLLDGSEPGVPSHHEASRHAVWPFPIEDHHHRDLTGRPHHAV